MTTSQGRDRGQTWDDQRVFSVVARTPGQNNQLFLSEIPSALGGLPFGVKYIMVVYPLATFNLTAATNAIADGVSMAQLYGTLSMYLAAQCPFHVAAGTRALFEAIDAYSLLQVLGFVSGAPCIGANDLSELSVTGAAPATDSLNPDKEELTRVPMGGQRRSGSWLQWLGPFYGSDATGTATISFRPVLLIPVGLRYGEDPESQVVPANWFNGQKTGRGQCSQQNAGYMNIILPSTVDNLAITWDIASGTNTFDVWALGALMDQTSIPSPQLPIIEEVRPGTDTKITTLPPGIYEFIAAMKQLTSAGAMQSHSYTNVALTQNGIDRINPFVDERLYSMSLGWMPPTGEAGYSIARQDAVRAALAPAVRRMNCCVPLYMSRGQLTKCIGSDEGNCLRITVNASGETTHRWVVARRHFLTEAFKKAAEAWALGAAAACGTDGPTTAKEPVFVNTAANGNLIASPSLSAIVPGAVKIGLASTNTGPG